MKTPVIIFALALLISGCTPQAMKDDETKIHEFPECYHQYRTVFDKCIEMNRAGQKVTALQVEEMIRKQPIK